MLIPFYYILDINECSNDTLHNCDVANKVQCQDTVGSYQCVCINSSYSVISTTECQGTSQRHVKENSHFFNNVYFFQFIEV